MFSTNRIAAHTREKFAAALLDVDPGNHNGQKVKFKALKKVLILHGSVTGTAKVLAEKLASRLSIDVTVVEAIQKFGYSSYHQFSNSNSEQGPNDIREISSIARFESIHKEYDYLVICISTWTDGAPPPGTEDFIEFLDDLVADFRVDKSLFSSLKGVAIIGLGNSAYSSFCTPALHIETCLIKLGAKFIAPLYKYDEEQNDALERAYKWLDTLLNSIAKADLEPCEMIEGHASSKLERASNCSCKTTAESESESNYSDSEAENLDKSENLGAPCDSEDLEDVAKPKESEMLTKRQRQQLVKEGYKIVGSHSAVKLCRWTKSQLRGRGGCYKHTFYGIESYLCMEATPSLACANKCVFCWRHHKNPVGRSWKWKTDNALEILEGIKLEHKKMIKQLKGVKSERFEEAVASVKHCALSLVGEPVMYPYINELTSGMHKDRISTFLVTNAQFPNEMRQLKPVTQLYVSIDAATPESLKAIDRPLHSDFWERYMECLDILSKIQCRTVFRLTLVKKYNMEEAIRYGQLILRGCPNFIEIKAVTYCGTSSGKSNDNITMADIPWHEEVLAYANAILTSNQSVADNYAIACEHKHSCCILLAQKKFYRNDNWYTWIDYSKFFSLIDSGEHFEALDYSIQTPNWAIIGASENGFDPAEKRVYTKGKMKRLQLVNTDL